MVGILQTREAVYNSPVLYYHFKEDMSLDGFIKYLSDKYDNLVDLLNDDGTFRESLYEEYMNHKTKLHSFSKNEFESIKKTLSYSATLDDLFETLNIMSEITYQDIIKHIDCNIFPIFSENKINDTSDIYSYDDTRVLLYGGIAGGWRLENRCNCGEASFNCISEKNEEIECKKCK